MSHTFMSLFKYFLCIFLCLCSYSQTLTIVDIPAHVGKSADSAIEWRVRVLVENDLTRYVRIPLNGVWMKAKEIRVRVSGWTTVTLMGSTTALPTACNYDVADYCSWLSGSRVSELYMKPTPDLENLYFGIWVRSSDFSDENRRRKDSQQYTVEITAALTDNALTKMRDSYLPSSNGPCTIVNNGVTPLKKLLPTALTLMTPHIDSEAKSRLSLGEFRSSEGILRLQKDVPSVIVGPSTIKEKKEVFKTPAIAVSSDLMSASLVVGEGKLSAVSQTGELINVLNVKQDNTGDSTSSSLSESNFMQTLVLPSYESDKHAKSDGISRNEKIFEYSMDIWQLSIFNIPDLHLKIVILPNVDAESSLLSASRATIRVGKYFASSVSVSQILKSLPKMLLHGDQSVLVRPPPLEEEPQVRSWRRQGLCPANSPIVETVDGVAVPKFAAVLFPHVESGKQSQTSVQNSASSKSTHVYLTSSTEGNPLWNLAFDVGAPEANKRFSPSLLGSALLVLVFVIGVAAMLVTWVVSCLRSCFAEHKICENGDDLDQEDYEFEDQNENMHLADFDTLHTNENTIELHGGSTDQTGLHEKLLSSHITERRLLRSNDMGVHLHSHQGAPSEPSWSQEGDGEDSSQGGVNEGRVGEPIWNFRRNKERIGLEDDLSNVALIIKKGANTEGDENK